MTQIRVAALLAATGVVFLCGGCVSLKRTPEARFFVLRPMVLRGPTAAEPGSAGAVGVMSVRIPGYLARPQVVTLGAGPHELRIDEFTRWGEPLEDGISRVLATNLAALLPDHRIESYPFPDPDALRVRVRLELETFSARSDGGVALEGRWELRAGRNDQTVAAAPIGLTGGPVPMEPSGAEPAAGVAALSDLLSEAARQIAAAVLALPPQDASER